MHKDLGYRKLKVQRFEDFIKIKFFFLIWLDTERVKTLTKCKTSNNKFAMHKDLGYRKLKVQRFEKIVLVALIVFTIVLLEIFNSNCVLGLQFSDRFTSRQSFILTFFLFLKRIIKLGRAGCLVGIISMSKYSMPPVHYSYEFLR